MKCLFKMRVAVARASSGPLRRGTPSPAIFTTLKDKLNGQSKCEKESYPTLLTLSVSVNLSSLYAWFASTLLSRLASSLMISSLNLSIVQHTASGSHSFSMTRVKHQYRVTRISQYLALASLLAGAHSLRINSQMAASCEPVLLTCEADLGSWLDKKDFVRIYHIILN